MPTILRADPFNSVLLDSPALLVTEEQLKLLRAIVDTACSDSQFADKAYASIVRMLTVGITEPPVISSLNPNTAVVGGPAVTMTITGTGFAPTAKVLQAGVSVAISSVTPTEIVVQFYVSSFLNPASIPVHVVNDNVISNSALFVITPAE